METFIRLFVLTVAALALIVACSQGGRPLQKDQDYGYGGYGYGEVRG